MVVVLPKGSFSNYLENEEFTKKSKTEVRKTQNEYLDNATATIDANEDLQNLVRFYGITMEEVCFIIRDDVGNFYYLKYVENAKIAVVFDVYALDILEILIDPAKKTAQIQTKQSMDLENDKYLAILERFSCEINSKPSIKKMIDESRHSDIYFIDTEESESRYVNQLLNALVRAVGEVDEKIGIAVYRNESSFLKMLIKGGKEIAERVKPTINIEEKKTIECDISVVPKKEGLLYLLYSYGKVKYAVDMINIDLTDALKKRTLNTLCNIVLKKLL